MRRSVVTTAGRRTEIYLLQPAIGLPRTETSAIDELGLAHEGCLRKVEQGGHHLPRLVVIVIDRLLSKNRQLGLHFSPESRQDTRRQKQFGFGGSVDPHEAVRSHGGRIAELLQAFFRAQENADNLSFSLPFADPESFLQGGEIQWIDGKGQPLRFSTRAIGFYANPDIWIGNPLNRDQKLHALSSDTSVLAPPRISAQMPVAVDESFPASSKASPRTKTRFLPLRTTKPAAVARLRAISGRRNWI